MTSFATKRLAGCANSSRKVFPWRAMAGSKISSRPSPPPGATTAGGRGGTPVYCAWQCKLRTDAVAGPAATAAILRSGYLSHRYDTAHNPFAINLCSERVGGLPSGCWTECARASPWELSLRDIALNVACTKIILAKELDDTSMPFVRPPTLVANKLERSGPQRLWKPLLPTTLWMAWSAQLEKVHTRSAGQRLT